MLVAVAAVLEIAYGYQRMAAADARYGELLAWFTRLVASDAFSVVALDGRAACPAASAGQARPPLEDHAPGVLA